MNTRKNILIDMGAIKTGGGVQLALNFLDLLSELDLADTIALLLPDRGPLADFTDHRLRAHRYRYPSAYGSRLLFEKTTLRKIYEELNIGYILTFFGAGLPHPVGIKSVVTTAYPIICYPDSEFWRYIDLKNKWRNRVNGVLRRMRLRAADTIIVETEVMRGRIARHLPFEPGRIHVLPPSPSRFVQPKATARQSGRNHCLLLSGVDPHKNLWRLPEIALELEALGTQDFKFLVTCDERAFTGQPRVAPPLWSQTRHRFRFLGAVHPRAIQSVYDEADFLLNLSDLESFSNNYLEAWKAGLPIVASDRDFARHICTDSAVYLEPHAPVAAAATLHELFNHPHRADALVAAGARHLARQRTHEERFAHLLKIVLDNPIDTPGAHAPPVAAQTNV